MTLLQLQKGGSHLLLPVETEAQIPRLVSVDTCHELRAPPHCCAGVTSAPHAVSTVSVPEVVLSLL